MVVCGGQLAGKLSAQGHLQSQLSQKNKTRTCFTTELIVRHNEAAGVQSPIVPKRDRRGWKSILACMN